jgi:hypothetical protein
MSQTTVRKRRRRAKQFAAPFHTPRFRALRELQQAHNRSRVRDAPFKASFAVCRALDAICRMLDAWGSPEADALCAALTDVPDAARPLTNNFEIAARFFGGYVGSEAVAAVRLEARGREDWRTSRGWGLRLLEVQQRMVEEYLSRCGFLREGEALALRLVRPAEEA